MASQISQAMQGRVSSCMTASPACRRCILRALLRFLFIPILRRSQIFFSPASTSIQCRRPPARSPLYHGRYSVPSDIRLPSSGEPLDDTGKPLVDKARPSNSGEERAHRRTRRSLATTCLTSTSTTTPPTAASTTKLDLV
jgi:hypothetical protein